MALTQQYLEQSVEQSVEKDYHTEAEYFEFGPAQL